MTKTKEYYAFSVKRKSGKSHKYVKGFKTTYLVKKKKCGGLHSEMVVSAPKYNTNKITKDDSEG